jgi:hypothetical protein
MNGSNDKDAAAEYDGTERRTRQHLRDIFEQAYCIAYPLLDTKQHFHITGSAHFLHVVLYDAFPNLHKQDVAILSASIERVFRERTKVVDQ